MSRLIWSSAALHDVLRLYRFLAAKNRHAAKLATTAIREGVQIIADQPGIGRPVDEMEPEYRQWMIDFGDSGYVVLYRCNSRNSAVILAVRHQREAGYDRG